MSAKLLERAAIACCGAAVALSIGMLFTPQSDTASDAHDGRAISEGIAVSRAASDPATTAIVRPMMRPGAVSADVLPPCVASLRSVADHSGITFAYGSAWLDGSSIDTAVGLARLTAGCPQAHITILGFTDPFGTAQTDQDLPTRRAQSVLTVLRAKGFDTRKFTARGYDEAHLLNEACPQCIGVERGVEFVVTADGQIPD